VSQICIHGHFYQPTRENPWTGEWDEQPSAAPYRDWNTRITDECYAPMMAARVEGEGGRTLKVMNNYAWMSFDIGPTLIEWLEKNNPLVLEAIVDADRQSIARFGRGAAMAQPFHHTILPLCEPEDRRIEIERGLEVFEQVFGRPTEGLWLPECAVDTPTLEDVAAAGVQFVVLAPDQVDAPTGQAYRVSLPSGADIAVIPYGAQVSSGVAFGGWLDYDVDFAGLLVEAAERDGLALVATDGESYGHHHPFGEMALAWALAQTENRITNIASWFAENPPTSEACIVENSSWSCEHGVERWRSACGCGAESGGDLLWRAPFRAALEALRFRALPHADDDARRHLLAMFTSCAWFFEEPGIEALQNLRHAACAVGKIRSETGVDLSEAFLADLAAMPVADPSILTRAVRDHLESTPPRRAGPANREAGVLLPVSSLGTLDHAVAFIDWLADAGVSLWQVLPLGPTDCHGCPYSSWSALAGNPELIGADVPPADSDEVWVEDAALFAAIKDERGGDPWWKWPEPLRDRDATALLEASSRLAIDIAEHRRQFLMFERKWCGIRRYAAARGVRIVGDIPIYIGSDSVDVWANPKLFRLDQVAGAPPDAFSDTGQWWGNPVYDWDAIAADGYRWWIERVRRALVHCDVLRLDHFIGFHRYWSIPTDATDAREGSWVPGPGKPLFDALEAALGPLPLIVEDLGDIDEATLQLRDELGLPGMVVVQFDMAHRECAVVYPGTHDNDTVRGWLGDVDPEAVWEVIDRTLSSPARWAVIQMQDWLGLGSEARMNVPGTVGEHNWTWKIPADALTAELAADVRRRLIASKRRRPQAHRWRNE